jgi:hypothetical protein
VAANTSHLSVKYNNVSKNIIFKIIPLIISNPKNAPRKKLLIYEIIKIHNLILYYNYD